MTDSFANHPQSIAEIKSDKSRNAADWTPRDALISVLRKLDAGEIAPSAIVIVSGDATAGSASIEWASSSPNMLVTLGLLTRFMWAIQETAEQV